jgi:hypothetical protein
LIPTPHDEGARKRIIDAVKAIGLRTSFGNNHLRFTGIKIGHDGSMSAGNCAVYEPYLNYATEDNYGVIHGYTDEELDSGEALRRFSEHVKEINRMGVKMKMGAIGDRGIDFFLDAMEIALKDYPRTDPRWTFEHCSLPTKAALARMKRLGITASSTVAFGWELGDQHRAFMGMERMQRYMPHKSYKEYGIVASGNADWTVCSANPMEQIHVAQETAQSTNLTSITLQTITTESSMATLTNN